MSSFLYIVHNLTCHCLHPLNNVSITVFTSVMYMYIVSLCSEIYLYAMYCFVQKFIGLIPGALDKCIEKLIKVNQSYM